MGRAINNENRLDEHEHRLKLIEDALEELLQTKVHHVDLHDAMDKHERSLREIEPDEEFTPPVGKRKKTKTKNPKKVESML